MNSEDKILIKGKFRSLSYEFYENGSLCLRKHDSDKFLVCLTPKEVEHIKTVINK